MPWLSVLATSREPLAVEGERAWPVPPLGDADAVLLFADRARLVAPSFAITDANAAAVGELCEKLDGLPLAIELAAARMRVLSVRQLTERLGDVFGVLTGGARSAPARHQALRATLDWSHDLLAADERAVFRRLAVFSGGFSLAAAERVAAFGDIAPGQVLDLLTRLADKSLVRVEHERYHLLATIREYAAEQLAAAAEPDEARRAHLAYFTEFAEQAGPRVERAAAAGLEAELDSLDLERANLRTASEFARQAGDAVAALRIAGQLGRYAYLRGHYHEIRQWMDLAVAAGRDAPPGLRARALFGSGRLAHLQCDYEPAVRGWTLRCCCTARSTTVPGSRRACRRSAAWPGNRAGTPGPPSCTRRAWSWRRQPVMPGRKPARTATWGSCAGCSASSSPRSRSARPR